MEDTSRFTEYWDAFAARFRQQLTDLSRTNTLNYQLADTTFTEMLKEWNDPQEECAAWLYDYSVSDHDKGPAVRAMVLKGLKLKNVPLMRPYSPLVGLIPVALATIGFAISAAVDAPIWVQAICMVVPVLAVWIPLRNYTVRKSREMLALTLEGYMNQLEEFRGDILSLMEV